MLKSEESFIKFMANRKQILLEKTIDLSNEINNSKEAEDQIFSKIREINISDKWIYDKAVKAFVANIRFYQEHDLKYIFDYKKLDLGNLANMYQLLKMPTLKFKEFQMKKTENFKPDTEITPKDLKYVDANISKQMEEKEE